ncbi:MAG: hypothetical protein J6D33_11940 [Turicibacter sp.]|nr:hypothetical protein [Turicibacter sp.]
MSYGILINNELEYAQSRYTTDEGQLIVNFDKNIEVMVQHGFKIVVDEKPEYNKDLQSLSVVDYEETDDSITIIYEVLNTPEPKPTPTLEERVISLESNSLDIVATTWDMDYRVCEIEWALEDSGILVVAQVAQAFNIKSKGVGTMALSRYEQAKIMILGGAYVRETLERQLTTYLKRGYLTKEEYDELIALMDARELVTEEEK